MTQPYIGCKQVMAWPEEKDGAAGYAVRYPDGYLSWSPKATFESAYLPMGEANDGSLVTAEMVQAFTKSVDYIGRHGNHGVFLVTLANGFTLIEESACVSPENYDENVAREIVEKKVQKRVWQLLGFLLATARRGVNGEAPVDE